MFAESEGTRWKKSTGLWQQRLERKRVLHEGPEGISGCWRSCRPTAIAVQEPGAPEEAPNAVDDIVTSRVPRLHRERGCACCALQKSVARGSGQTISHGLFQQTT